ncbi:hypothetical protein SAMN05428950_1048 [Sphingomonas sp. OV641]|nr:hypothetical protein SAMN05428950_1048 [Sphingomonas sp. OV641]
MMPGWIAAIAIIAGATALYVAAPHQALLAGHVVRRRVWAWGGAALLALALVLLLCVQGPATAVFTWATGAMLVWSVVPVAARWWRFRGEAA